jgi:hypothetical protein
MSNFDKPEIEWIDAKARRILEGKVNIVKRAFERTLENRKIREAEVLESFKPSSKKRTWAE